MMNVLIADDHALLRSGLRRILAEELAATSFGEARDADELIQHIRRGSWDLVLLDISMPGRSGLDALRELRALRPKLPVLVLSMHAEEQFAIRALRAGANGYITKERAPEELIEAARRVLEGRRYVSPSLAEKLAEELASGRDGAPHDALSAREFEVLRLLAGGKSVSDIAEQLSLSAKTVSTYRTRILEKMGLGSNAELAHYALRYGLIPPL